MGQRLTKTLPDPELDQLAETVQESKPLQESELDRLAKLRKVQNFRKSFQNLSLTHQ